MRVRDFYRLKEKGKGLSAAAKAYILGSACVSFFARTNFELTQVLNSVLVTKGHLLVCISYLLTLSSSPKCAARGVKRLFCLGDFLALAVVVINNCSQRSLEGLFERLARPNHPRFPRPNRGFWMEEAADL